MDKGFESVYHTAEDSNWWFRARRDFIVRALRAFAISPSARILDIGCGGGGLLSHLQANDYTNVTGADASPEAVAFCSSRGLTSVILDDAQTLSKFTANSFDVIIASDILEHLDLAEKALQRWSDLLAPGGSIIIFVPAFNMLWSERDRLNKHITRYTKKSLFYLLVRTRLHVRLASYWNFFMFIPYAILIQIKRAAKNKIVTIKKQDTLINKFLTRLLMFENKLILSGLRFSFGVSFVAIAQKK